MCTVSVVDHDHEPLVRTKRAMQFFNNNVLTKYCFLFYSSNPNSAARLSLAANHNINMIELLNLIELRFWLFTRTIKSL